MLQLSTRLAVFAAAALATTAVTTAPASAGQRPDSTTDVRIIGFNDLHGNLEPPAGANGRIRGITAGGAEYLAAHLSRA